MSKAKLDQFEVNLAQYKNVVKQLVAFKGDIKPVNAKQVLALLDEFYPLHAKLQQNRGLSDSQVKRQKRTVADVSNFKLPVNDVRAMSEAAKKIVDAETPKPVPTKILPSAEQAKILYKSIKANVAASKAEEKEKALEKNMTLCKSKYAEFLGQLDDFKQYVDAKAKAHDRYKTLNTKIGSLVSDLKTIGNNFFDKPATAKSFNDFVKAVTSALTSAEQECKNHRGWHKLHPIIKGFVGLLATISGFPALYIYAKSGWQGYVNTFFKTPDTATSVKFKTLKEIMIKSENADEAVISPKQ
ncbi:MAG: hypothetical protein WC627_09215 [Legionella sp.]|jgi:hypothetical protein